MAIVRAGIHKNVRAHQALKQGQKRARKDLQFPSQPFLDSGTGSCRYLAQKVDQPDGRAKKQFRR